jgi:hypothetical protein
MRGKKSISTLFLFLFSLERCVPIQGGEEGTSTELGRPPVAVVSMDPDQYSAVFTKNIIFLKGPSMKLE